MASLRLGDELGRVLSESLSKSTAKEIKDVFLDKKPAFVSTIQRLLDKHCFVHISNVPFSPSREVLSAIISCFGKFRQPVENTDIRIDCDHDGCALEYLELHNDDAILLDKQPTFAILQVAEECPLKKPLNGIVKVDDIVYFLEHNNADLLNRLLNVKVPMLSSKVQKIVKNNKTEIHKVGEICNRTTILQKENGMYISRFNLGRIRYFYYAKGIKQDFAEASMIYRFLEVANCLKTTMYLKKNDLLVYNNKRTLHDRGECGLELNLDGHINSRKFYIAFAL